MHARELFPGLLGAVLGCVGPQSEPELECQDEPVHESASVSVGEGGAPSDGDELVLFEVDGATQIQLAVDLVPDRVPASGCYWISARLYVINPENPTPLVFETPLDAPDLLLDESGAATIDLRFPTSPTEIVTALGEGNLYLEAKLIPNTGPPVRTSLSSPTPRIAAAGAALPEPSSNTSCDWGEPLAAELFHPTDDAPYGPELAAELVIGSQGATMITPRLVLDNPDGLAEQCLIFDAYATLADTNISMARLDGIRSVLSRGADGRLYSDPVFLPLWELDESQIIATGIEVSVTARVGSRRLRTQQWVPIADDE